MTNTYLEGFRKKSDSDLENIAANSEIYIDEARAAATQVLKERKEGVTPEMIEVEEAASVAEQVREATAFEEAPGRMRQTLDVNAPELHSKNVINAFSIIFSTLFGAVLLMYNMKQTGQREGRNLVLIFGIGYTFLIGNIITQFNMPTFAGIVANAIGATILNEYFWNKYIGKDIQYRKRSWIRPAVISVLITIPLAFLLFYEV